MAKERSHVERVLNTWAVILIVWSVYRAYFKTSLPVWFDEFVAKPIVFILPVYWFVQKIEKKQFLQAIDLKFKKLYKELLVGILFGGAFFVALGLGYVLRIKAPFESIPKQLFSNNAFYFLVVALATGISEEILSRGFVLKRLYEESKNIYSASFFASILFFFLHIPILFTSKMINGALLLQAMTVDLILSFTISLVFLQRKNLVAPIVIHALYSLGFFLFL